NPNTRPGLTERHKTTPQYSKNGRYGSSGIFRAEDFTQSDGTKRDNMGVHSGRENMGGVSAPTNGCIRTTDTAIATIAATAETDPLETITVSNNQYQNMSMEGDGGPAK